MPAHPSLPGSRDIAESLGIAVVASSRAPLLLLDDSFRIIAASTSFSQTFALSAARLPGQSIFSIGDGEWGTPQLRSLLRATVAGAAQIEAYEMDLHSPARGLLRLVLNAQRLDYGLGDTSRVLLTITDVTDSRREEARHAALLREKDHLLGQKAMLLQEVRHRVANSLQIIASVLLQNARRVNSAESRGHLHDAHQRVMSVAALQHQLAASSLEGVPLGAYLTHLCESIAASMIGNRDRVSLTVDVDDSVVDSDVSISLGLIVTELVINALKYAFPNNRKGAIRVTYAARGGDWTLEVADDGVGLPAKRKAAGLGTSIVEALCRQLQAQPSVEDRHPGVSASVIHRQQA